MHTVYVTYPDCTGLIYLLIYSIGVLCRNLEYLTYTTLASIMLTEKQVTGRPLERTPGAGFELTTTRLAKDSSDSSMEPPFPSPVPSFPLPSPPPHYMHCYEGQPDKYSSFGFSPQ